jgi:hypothetical protein
VVLFVVQLPASIALSYFVLYIYSLIGIKKIKLNFLSLSALLILATPLGIGAVTLNHNLTPLFYFFMMPAMIAAVYVFGQQNSNVILKVLKQVFWICSLIVFVLIYVFRDEVEPLGAVFPWSSTNGIPSYLMVIQITYASLFFLINNRLPIASSVALLIISIFGLGRGAMFLSALMVLISIATNIYSASKGCNKNTLAIYILIFSAILSISIPINFQFIYEFISDFLVGSGFGGGLFDEHRSNMNKDYLAKLDFWSFILGQNYAGTSIDNYYGGNPHNSFIRVHSFYGIFGLIVAFTPFAIILLSENSFFRKSILMLLWTILIARAFTEPIFFPTPLDFFYCLFGFMIFNLQPATLIPKKHD